MKRNTWIALIAGMLFSSFPAYASELTEVESGSLLRAIEDYRFSDYEPAINTFQSLYRRHPDNVKVLRYLALSYEETESNEMALSFYRQWLTLDPVSRDAHLGTARVMSKLKMYSEGSQLMLEWVTSHPDDVEASVQLGNLLVLDKRYKESKQLWSRMLSNFDLHQSYQSAAHYYLAHIAYVEGDINELEKHLESAIATDPDGQYASAAASLRTQGTPPRRDGFFGWLEAGGYYSSNVKLLPDILTTTNKRGDSFSQLGAQLEYRYASFAGGYSGQFTTYRRETDYNLYLHSAFLQWQAGNWIISPRYEHGSLGGEYLYQAGGADIGWAKDNLYLSYSFRSKVFSKNYGTNASDLSRLGGMSNTVALQYVVKSSWDVFTFGVDLHDEATKGDLTHPKSDSYRQAGGSIAYYHRSGRWSRGLSLQGYYRQYLNADPTILIIGSEKRRDRYIKLGGNVQYNITDANTLQLKGHWQSNYSNYEFPLVTAQFGKSYQEWQLGLNWRYSW